MRECCAPGTPVAATPCTLRDSGSRSAAPQTHPLHLGRGPQLLGKTFEKPRAWLLGELEARSSGSARQRFDRILWVVLLSFRVYIGDDKIQESADNRCRAGVIFRSFEFDLLSL